MAHKQQSESPITLQKYLHGVDYPASKADLRKAAEENDAPEDVLKIIDDLSGDEFDAPTDVTKAFAEAR